ncbi:hypothetical protein BT96DRAFT_776692, partial [Gymnopus androsaceus JB14]
ANLALITNNRYLPESMFIGGIIPGPKEPDFEQCDHFLRPIIEQFRRTWSPGVQLSHTADSDSNVLVEAAIILSVNDLPAAQKLAGLQGHSSGLYICSVCDLQGKNSIMDTNHSRWSCRNVQRMRDAAYAWRTADTLAQRKKIFEEHGVRWLSMWLLPYWDPTRMLVVDSMHCILEGIVHYHCRHVLCLDDAASNKISADGFQHAYDWPWEAYHPDNVPSAYAVPEKHIVCVGKIHELLCLALEGPKSLNLLGLWNRLDRIGTLASLHYVAFTLDLVPCQLHVSPQFAVFSNHYSDFDATYQRLNCELASTAQTLPTNTPEMMQHICTVICNTKRPSWINSVPLNYGLNSAGTIKADEWRTLSTIFIPIALVTLWGDDDGVAPPSDDSDEGLLFQALQHSMALFQATLIACRYTMTSDRIQAYRTHLTKWIQELRPLFPHTRESPPRVNIHMANHIYDFLKLFGPVISWWCFPFERLIGALQKVNTNDHIGGPLESTIMKSQLRIANIRRWLRRIDCPEALKQLKILFDKCF